MNQRPPKTPVFYSRTEAATDFIFQTLGSEITLATPLGLGKPNQLLNQIYDRAAADSQIRLQIFTALSLTVPNPPPGLAQRFLKPFATRHWGSDYPQLKYYLNAQKGQLPPNIHVHEFYFQAGTALKSSHLQRHYQSVNYTHVAENILRHKANVVVQLISARAENGKRRLSLSCNPDLTLDVADLYAQAHKPLMMVGVIHPDLPFLEGESEVDESFFDVIVDSKETNHELFALPRTPISPEDHLIGFHASQLVIDGGTLQIGIGSLSEAIAASLIIRHTNNFLYRKAADILKPRFQNFETFQIGLYGLTEMLTDSFMHLRKAGILKREVKDETSRKRTYLHGSFFLGSKSLYQWLRNLSQEDQAGLRMTRVSKVNDLYDPQEILLRHQRIQARFFNTCMQMSPLGEASSETLPDAKVVSGVGGQYNFVAMSHELKGARSVLMLRSTRFDAKGQRVSNIVWKPGHVTIPRHLRDIVITEYGTADLRGKSDEQCICEMLNITDSQFQQSLLSAAQASGKVSKDYQIPEAYQNNHPEQIADWMRNSDLQKIFPPFPFGSDFSKEEESLALALQKLEQDQKSPLLILRRLLRPLETGNFEKELQRMELQGSFNLKDRIFRRLLLSALSETVQK